MQVAQGGLAFTSIHPDELRRRLAWGESFAVVDARSEGAAQRNGRTMAGAVRIPCEELVARQRELPKGKSLLLLADLPAQESCALDLLRAGFTDVYLIEGGFEAFERAGGETVPR